MNEAGQGAEVETYSYTSSWRQVAKVSHHAVAVSQGHIWLRLVSQPAGEVRCEENCRGKCGV
jgi:hypothetical protein